MSVLTIAGVAIFPFIELTEVTLLRAVSREICVNVAEQIWGDRNNVIPGAHVMSWLTSFPRVRAVNLSNQRIPSHAFQCLQNFVKLDLSFSEPPPEGGLDLVTNRQGAI